ncbi:MAG: tetratricopeptide repeat protein [Labilithrix sp.]|nr:tetratricopeptide repeat protein [Labilithrix sp.]
MKSLPGAPLVTRLFSRLAAPLATILIVALTLLGAPRIALADEAAARAHFKKGIELYDKKQYAEALDAFQDAYKEKPSAGIKQNIALSLKGLGRLAEAATAFDEALDEGKDTLKPETRAAIERELAELSRSVATVRLSVVTEDRRPVDDAVISVQPAAPPGSKAEPLPAGAHRRPIRLTPGIYTFTARAPGYADPPEKKLALVSGAPVDATFLFASPGGQGAPPLGPNEGFLTVETNVPDASIRVDGVELPQRGTFRGKVTAGAHRIEISSPGWKTTTLEANVPEGASVEQPVTLQAIGEAPPEYTAPAMKPPKPKKLYLAITGAIDTVSYRLGVPLGEPAPYGARRSNFAGATVGGRAGYLVAKMFALELLAEVGAMQAKYKRSPTDDVESETNVVHWQLTPMARFVTPGKVRFTTGAGFGLHGLGVESKLAQPGRTLTKKGTGVGFSFLVDAGMQADVGPLFLELAAFLNVHGVGPVRDDSAPEGRFFYASPATRGGLRVGLGIPF